MATVTERFEGRSEVLLSGSNRAEIPYVISGGIDEADVKAALTSAVGSAYAGLDLQSIEITERVNETTWLAVAYYGEESGSGSSSSNEESWTSFDTSGGNQHITQSIKTVSRYGPGMSILLGGAIGYDGETVLGVDITVPIYNFTETHYLQDSVVTSGYRQKIFNLTGKVNLHSFKGFQAGEVLFMGANGAKRGDDDWEITFRFAALPNKSHIAVGEISGIAKKGWEYMWVQYADEIDTASNQLVKKPIAVYVEQVYDTANFATLGIGR